jgi:Flp pilus assembly CpaF family ATPase
MNVTDELIRPLFRAMGLEEYLLDPEVSELMVNNGLAFIDKGGELMEIPVRMDNYKLMAAIEVIGQSIGDQIDEYKKPWLDSRLPDGSRVAAAYPPIYDRRIAGARLANARGARCASGRHPPA